MKKKVIVASAVTIALSASLAVGGTYALFTSESKVNVAVNSGKVNVYAYAENLTLYSPTLIDINGIVDDVNAATATTFYNGGTADIVNGNEVVLERMTPGDSVSFDIVVKNESNVTVKYQTRLAVEEGYDLFSGLSVTFNGSTDKYDGMTAYSNWETLTEKGEVERTTVTIELPVEAGNQYQDLDCTLAFTVNAIQGNAITENPESGVTYIYTASDLMTFAESVNNYTGSGNPYSGKRVVLMNDIDLAGYDWEPIGQTGAPTFAGWFDGQGYTIKNMTVNNPSESTNRASGFFGWIENNNALIDFVKFENANVTGSHYVGVVAGYLSGNIVDCEVKNSTVTGINMNSEANGDKIGGFVGYINAGEVARNSVSGCTIIGNRDIGGFVGAIVTGTTFINNSVENTNIYYALDKDYASAGEIVSGRLTFDLDSTNNANNVNIYRHAYISTAYGLSCALNNTYAADTTITLMNDIDLAGAEWGAHILKGTNNAALTIDGNGKTIYGLTSSSYIDGNGFNSNGLVTCIQSSLSSVTFKNLTVSGANLTNNGGWNAATGVFVGDINTVKVTFDTCTVTGANVTSDAYAAGFVGYVQDVYCNDPTLSCPLTLKNCSVTNSTFNGSDATGALVGLNNGSTIIDGATVTGNTINGGAGYSAAALVGTSVNGTTATNVTVSGNIYYITNYTGYQIYNTDYGYIYHFNQTYTVDGTSLY